MSQRRRGEFRSGMMKLLSPADGRKIIEETCFAFIRRVLQPMDYGSHHTVRASRPEETADHLLALVIYRLESTSRPMVRDLTDRGLT